MPSFSQFAQALVADSNNVKLNPDGSIFLEAGKPVFGPTLTTPTYSSDSGWGYTPVTGSNGDFDYLLGWKDPNWWFNTPGVTPETNYNGKSGFLISPNLVSQHPGFTNPSLSNYDPSRYSPADIVNNAESTLDWLGGGITRQSQKVRGDDDGGLLGSSGMGLLGTVLSFVPGLQPFGALISLANAAANNNPLGVVTSALGMGGINVAGELSQQLADAGMGVELAGPTLSGDPLMGQTALTQGLSQGALGAGGALLTGGDPLKAGLVSGLASVAGTELGQLANDNGIQLGGIGGVPNSTPQPSTYDIPVGDIANSLSDQVANGTLSLDDAMKAMQDINNVSSGGEWSQFLNSGGADPGGLLSVASVGDATPTANPLTYQPVTDWLPNPQVMPSTTDTAIPQLASNTSVPALNNLGQGPTDFSSALLDSIPSYVPSVDWLPNAPQMQTTTATAVPQIGTGTSVQSLNALGGGPTDVQSAITSATAPDLAFAGTSIPQIDYQPVTDWLPSPNTMPTSTNTAVPEIGTNSSVPALNNLGQGPTSLASTIDQLAAATTPDLASVGLTGYTPTISDAVTTAATTPQTAGFDLLDWMKKNQSLVTSAMGLLGGGGSQPQYMGGGGAGLLGGGGGASAALPAIGLLSMTRPEYHNIFAPERNALLS